MEVLAARRIRAARFWLEGEWSALDSAWLEEPLRGPGGGLEYRCSDAISLRGTYVDGHRRNSASRFLDLGGSVNVSEETDGHAATVSCVWTIWMPHSIALQFEAGLENRVETLERTLEFSDNIRGTRRQSFRHDFTAPCVGASFCIHTSTPGVIRIAGRWAPELGEEVRNYALSLSLGPGFGKIR